MKPDSASSERHEVRSRNYCTAVTFLAAGLAGYMMILLPVSPAAAQTRNDLSSMRVVQVRIASQSFSVWMAETTAQRQFGLQYVQPAEMAIDQGMLFVYPQDVLLGFRMYNTLIALDIAFLQSDGTIVDIQRMVPLTSDRHIPSSAYRYALEVYQGTFARLGVRAGQTVFLPSNSPSLSIPGDINGDGSVNVADLQVLVVAWGGTDTTAPPSSNWDPNADLDSDGYVSVGDVYVLLAHWDT